jgi:hypothetical protein
MLANAWLQLLTPTVQTERRGHKFKELPTDQRPCARCEKAPRYYKSYCKACHDYYRGEGNRRKTIRREEDRRK